MSSSENGSQPAAGLAASVSHVTKRYGDRPALSDVSLELAAGQVLGFIGPNGAGKTTLIKVLCGLTRPDDGGVSVFAQPLRSGSRCPDGIGLVTEGTRLIGRLSARRNLRLLAGIRGEASHADIDAVIRRVGLDPSDRRPVRAYSLGMGQRLALAQALMERPRLLILDEPTNGLDPAGIVLLRDIIADVARSGAAVFLASHLLTEVEQVCDRVLFVREGRIVREYGERELGRARSQEAARVRFSLARVRELERLRRLADERGWSVEADDRDEREATLDVGRAAPVDHIIRAVVLAEIGLLAVAPERPSLEEDFLKLSGEASA